MAPPPASGPPTSSSRRSTTVLSNRCRVRPPRARATGARNRTMKRLIAGTIGAVLALGTLLAAQAPQGAGPGPAPTPRAQAPVDLTGTWVSVVTEDWRWRMVTP